MSTAPYRFIPIEPGFVATPPVSRSDIAFDRPVPGGSISATLTVTWTAETPVCIGTAAPDGTIGPLRMGERYGLPGSSLRGMIRAVLEIASFSHLGRINGHRHHGFRDFQGIDNPQHSIKVGDLKAGWLTWHDKQWTLRPADPPNNRIFETSGDHLYVRVAISNIVAGLTTPTPGEITSVEEWLDAEMWTKYQEFLKKKSSLIVKPTQKIEDSHLPNDTDVYKIFRESGDMGRAIMPKFGQGEKDLYLVCGGRVPKDGHAQLREKGNLKSTECLFPGPSDVEEFPIPQDWMNLFHQMHADPSREGGNPRGAWRAWLLGYGWETAFPGFDSEKDAEGDETIRDAMARVVDRGPSPLRDGEAPPKLRGIPVFWKGEIDPTKPPGQQSFWFSLSRVMRVPYEYSVGQVAQRLYDETNAEYDLPRMADPGGWDFARALFGEVDGANRDAREDKRGPHADLTHQEDALRGRVAFGLAWADGNREADRQVKTGVFGQPRESYWPFYLRDQDAPETSVSYGSDRAVPAGRKRTVVRRQALHHSQWPKGNEKNRNVETRISFLPTGTVFSGQIRVHNLHPVEFGALVWALTFGDPSGGHWHQIGRAKGMGYGALRPTVTFAKDPVIVGVDGDQPQNCLGWINRFTEYMQNQFPDPEHGQMDFHDHPTIALLRQFADPATGEANKAGLDTQSLEDYSKWPKADEKRSLAGGQGSLSYRLSVRKPR